MAEKVHTMNSAFFYEECVGPFAMTEKMIEVLFLSEISASVRIVSYLVREQQQLGDPNIPAAKLPKLSDCLGMLFLNQQLRRHQQRHHLNECCSQIY